MSKWISVKEKFPSDKYDPPTKVKIKINNNDDFVTTCNFRMLATRLPGRDLIPHWFSDKTKNGVVRFYYGVTHWMPFPEPL